MKKSTLTPEQEINRESRFIERQEKMIESIRIAYELFSNLQTNEPDTPEYISGRLGLVMIRNTYLMSNLLRTSEIERIVG